MGNIVLGDGYLFDDFAPLRVENYSVMGVMLGIWVCLFEPFFLFLSVGNRCDGSFAYG